MLKETQYYKVQTATTKPIQQVPVNDKVFQKIHHVQEITIAIRIQIKMFHDLS